MRAACILRASLRVKGFDEPVTIKVPELEGKLAPYGEVQFASGFTLYGFYCAKRAQFAIAGATFCAQYLGQRGRSAVIETGPMFEALARDAAKKKRSLAKKAAKQNRALAKKAAKEKRAAAKNAAKQKRALAKEAAKQNRAAAKNAAKEKRAAANKNGHGVQ